MMRKVFLLMMIAILAAWGQGVSAWAQGDDSYRVGAGDVLYLSVVGHNDLTTTQTVSPDGTISFPYINTVKVEGKTLKEISTDMVKALSPNYIQFPEIIVRLEEPKSQKFYVYGEIRTPGVFRLEKNMTVLKAVSMAGGYTAFANKSVVKVLRPKEGVAGYDSLVVNVDNVIRDPAQNNDIFIRNEDIVVVVQK